MPEATLPVKDRIQFLLLAFSMMFTFVLHSRQIPVTIHLAKKRQSKPESRALCSVPILDLSVDQLSAFRLVTWGGPKDGLCSVKL